MLDWLPAIFCWRRSLELGVSVLRRLALVTSRSSWLRWRDRRPRARRGGRATASKGRWGGERFSRVTIAAATDLARSPAPRRCHIAPDSGSTGASWAPGRVASRVSLPMARRDEVRLPAVRPPGAGLVGPCPGCGEWNTLVERGRGHGAPSRRRPRRSAGTAPRAGAAARRRGAGGRAARDRDRRARPGARRRARARLAGPARRLAGDRQEHADRRWRSATSPPAGAAVLYVSGEESAAQVRLRAERLGEPALEVPAIWPRPRSRR